MTVYALKHPDGRWLYHLPAPDGFPHNVTGVYADGQPMEKLPKDWWATTAEASRLTTTGQPRPKTLSYTLKAADAESVRYPATLSVDEYSERRDDEDNLWEFYSAVCEEQPAVEHVYEGPIVVLEGREPPGPDEPQWVAKLPHALTERPEYKHLFPGRISGLRDHVHKVIENLPKVKYCFNGYQGYTGLHVVIRVPYDEPRTEFRRDTSRRTGKPLKTGRQVPVLVERRLQLPVPADVHADTYEQALALWDEQVTFWVQAVEVASVAACSHCDGTGHVPHGAEQYTP
ncbi:hypothetical protein [Streptomyces griseorubiginosus]|uniref:hypothetical protein n=1 Tax=Streptomyces griseorubiginosus TaxID=67304 RepID=UPI00332A4553